MSPALSLFARLLWFIALVAGMIVPSPVLAALSTTVSQAGPQIFSFPIQPGPAGLPSGDPNQVAGSPAPAAPAAAAAAGVDDRYNTDQTGWFIYEHQTISDVMNTATNNNLRVVDLFVENTTNPYQLTASYVSNTGSYARSWWLLVNVTPADLLTFVTANNARIVVLKAFDDPAPGGSVRFYAVMISNSGADAKGWWFYHGQTTAQLTALWQANNARITQINSYVKGGVTLYDAVMISNTGTDASGWWWYVNATAADLTTHLSANNARLIDLDIDPATGKYNAVMVSCSTGCPMWWWWVGVSTSNLLNVVAQDGARIIDANSTPGCGDRCWSIVLINNSNAITSRVGELLRSKTDGTVGLYLKQVSGPVLANLMDSTVFEPASTIKAITHLYTMQRLQAGSAALTTSIPKYIPPVGSSCPGNTVSGSETIQTADQEMMRHSDNTRTRELNDYFGVANVNTNAVTIGMAHTAILHVVGCGGPIPDQTTLDDLAVLYEKVANNSLLDSTHKALFYSQMAGKAQYLAEGYDWTGLWSTDLPAMIHQEMPAWSNSKINYYMSKMNLAYKAGNYNICTTIACTSLLYHISIAGWAQIPFCDGGGSRQYVFGVYVTNATNSTNSSNAFNSTKSELLREQIHAGLASCAINLYALHIPNVSR